jgi:hypothetical protein
MDYELDYKLFTLDEWTTDPKDQLHLSRPPQQQ